MEEERRAEGRADTEQWGPSAGRGGNRTEAGRQAHESRSLSPAALLTALLVRACSLIAGPADASSTRLLPTPFVSDFHSPSLIARSSPSPAAPSCSDRLASWSPSAAASCPTPVRRPALDRSGQQQRGEATSFQLIFPSRARSLVPLLTWSMLVLPRRSPSPPTPSRPLLPPSHLRATTTRNERTTSSKTNSSNRSNDRTSRMRRLLQHRRL